MEHETFIQVSTDVLKAILYDGRKFTKDAAWLDLRLRAATAERVVVRRGVEVHLEQGEFIASIDELAKEWQWSNNTVIKFLKEKTAPQSAPLTAPLSVKCKNNKFSVLRLNCCKDISETAPQSAPLTAPHQETKESFPPHPLYKEKKENYPHTLWAGACTCEGDRNEEHLLAEMAASEIWKEQVCMLFHQRPDQLAKRFEQFKLVNSVRGVKHIDLNDIKRHFADWMNLQLKTEKNETERNNRRPTEEERDAEFAAHIAAKLARCK